MNPIFVERIQAVNSEEVRRFIAIEQDAFGSDGALNYWSFPAFIRHGAVYVLYSNNQLAGIADIMRDFSEPRLAFVYNFVIQKEVRGRGLALAFIEEIKKRLRDEGISRIQLTVAPGNIAAIAVYEKSGFECIEELFDEYGQGVDRLLYELRMDERNG